MKRRDRWTRLPGRGWCLDGTNLVLDFDPLNSEGSLRGAWLLTGSSDPKMAHAAIDHYLDGAMAYVEEYLEDLR